MVGALMAILAILAIEATLAIVVVAVTGHGDLRGDASALRDTGST